MLTASDIAKLFPDVGTGNNRDQKFRDWAMSAGKGGKGKAELASLGYQAIAQPSKNGKTSYFFKPFAVE